MGVGKIGGCMKVTDVSAMRFEDRWNRLAPFSSPWDRSAKLWWSWRVL